MTEIRDDSCFPKGLGAMTVSATWNESLTGAHSWLCKTLWLGGSPCAGKSSVADRLAARYGLTLYRCDDAFDRHLAQCNAQDHPVLSAISRMSWDEIWMRPVAVQVAAELDAYREEWGMILDDLQRLPEGRPLLVEGCALLPELVALLVPPQRARWFVPTPAFQRQHYAQRAFIQDILVQCRDPQTAWDNWMQRDEQFGRAVADNAALRGYTVEWVDGQRSIEELTALTAAYFGFTAATPLTVHP
jgi:adenylate kinase family enzyme